MVEQFIKYETVFRINFNKRVLLSNIISLYLSIYDLTIFNN